MGFEAKKKDLERATPITSELRVAMRPAYRGSNPYAGMLAAALEAEGIEVEEMALRSLRHPFAADRIVLHWPDEFFYTSGRKGTVKALVRLGLIWAGKLFRRQKIVWVVHNLVPHDRSGRSFNLARCIFFAALDGLILLSDVSRRLMAERYPLLTRRPCLVIPHGHFKDRVGPPTPAIWMEGAPVRLAFVGQVRRYKLPDRLARIVCGMPSDKVSLRIAGLCSDPALRRELAALSGGADNVAVEFGQMSEEALAHHVDEAHGVVLPYRDILNSGSALFALSRARPVLAPRLGSLTELQEQVGPDWLQLYEGALTEATVHAFVDRLRAGPREGEPDLSAHDWTAIGQRTAAFLRTL